MNVADELTLQRCTTRCGCTDGGPGADCLHGQQLFSAVRQAYAGASGVHPSNDPVWSLYETCRFAYYRHLGVQVNLALLPTAEPAELLASYTMWLYNAELATLEDCERVAAGILGELRPDLVLPGSP
jgi:hypothetical protein